MYISDKAILALTLFAERLRSRGEDAVADELEMLAEHYASKEKAQKKKKP